MGRLEDGPSIVLLRNDRLLAMAGHFGHAGLRGRYSVALGRDPMTFLNDDFMNRPWGTVLRRELALLNAADNTDVVTFFVTHRNFGERAVKGKIEPVGLFPPAILSVIQ